MAGGIDWFRWHHGSVTDPKFQLVARKAGASLPDVLAVWAYVLEQASGADERGTFNIDAEAVDCMFGFPATQTRTADILAAMQERGIVDGRRIAAWEKRQPKRERPEDNSASRTRDYRAKKRHHGISDATTGHVTPCDATTRQKTPRGEESREEQETAHAVSPACEAVGKALETGGVAAEDINLADPVLVELVAQGATPAEFEGLAKEAVRKGKRSPFAWTLVVLQQRRSEAAGITLTQRPEDAPDAWMGTRSGIESKAAEVGLPRWDECEQWPQYRARVLKAAGFEPRRVA